MTPHLQTRSRILIHRTIRDIRSSTHSSSLIVFAFIGHAYIDLASNLTLSSTSGKQTVEFNTIKSGLILYKETLKNLHSLGFMDCSYASGVRSKVNRTCQVLAACRDGTVTNPDYGVQLGLYE